VRQAQVASAIPNAQDLRQSWAQERHAKPGVAFLRQPRPVINFQTF